MKIDISISDVKELCEFFWYKYQDEHDKYCELQNVLSEHSDEYDAEKHHELYMHFYNYSKYLSRFYHWSDMLHYMVMEEDSRE